MVQNKKAVDFNFISIILLILLNDKTLINGQGSRTQPEYNSAAVKATSNPGAGGGEIINPKSLSLNEPSCEELRAMWRFSKRQSRASEITNEIPTYTDPFSYNIYEPSYYAGARNLGGRRMPNARYRGDHFPRPVYGRVVHKQPVQPLQAMPGSGLYEPSVINRGATDDIPRIYANDNRNSGKPSQPRRLPKLRMGGGVVSNAGSNQNAGAMQAADIFGGTGLSSNLLTPQRGSFQRLKELVWTERAKELQQQRKNEEMVARAARLKELTNGQHYKGSNRRQQQQPTSKSANTKFGDSQFYPSMNINSNSKRSDPLQNLANEYLDDSDKVAYLGGDDSSEYATNELFNKFNNDNINDYYFYINELLFNAENAEKNND